LSATIICNIAAKILTSEEEEEEIERILSEYQRTRK
jgi:hypothetical protein